MVYQFSFLLDQKRNKKIFMRSYCLFGIHESSISSLNFQFSNAKRKELAALKQLFFLRILQTFDARLRKLRTMNSLNKSNLRKFAQFAVKNLY